MKHILLFAIIFALAFPIHSHSQEYSETGAVQTENESSIKGDIFFDCAMSVDFCILNTIFMLKYIEENRSDILECVCAVPYFSLFNAACIVCCPGELVYYRKQDDDGSFSNYFGLGYPLNMTAALYFGDRFSMGIKFGIDLDLCIGNCTFKIGANASSSLVLAYRLVSLNAGIRAGYFDGEWYLSPTCSISVEFNKEAFLSASYTDANFFGKNIRRISLGCTLLLCKSK